MSAEVGPFATRQPGPHRSASQMREALTRGPHPGRRDRAEPLARPTRGMRPMRARMTVQPDLAPNWAYRRRGFSNLLRMGHCAPTAMQTLLDVSSTDEEWLVRLSAGMPGGIGNTGHECGAVTSPLVLMGIQHGLREVDRGLPVIFDRGARAVPRLPRLPQDAPVPGDPRRRTTFRGIASARSCARRSSDEAALDGDRAGRHPGGHQGRLLQAVLALGRERLPLRPGRAQPPRLLTQPSTGSSSMPPRRSWAGRCSWAGPAARSPRA